MKRRLIIMRHAKSSWNTDSPTDHERPLNKRGNKDAPRIAQRLVELEWIPQLVVSSDAQRTRETWERMSGVFGGDIAVDYTRELYGGGLDEIVECSFEWPSCVSTVLLVGHNPGWGDAVGSLSGVLTSMTTANAALLEGEGEDWHQALDGKWKLTALLRPKEL